MEKDREEGGQARSRPVAWLPLLVEYALYCVGLFAAIPPVPSEPGRTYGFLPGGAVACSIFAVSRLMATRRGAERTAVALAQIVAFVAFAWTVRVRCQM